MVTIQDLLYALMYSSGGLPGQYVAYVCRDTGRIFYRGEFDGCDDEDLPDDFDSGCYIAIPHRKELNLGRALVLEFAATHMPGDEARIRQIFNRAGAYARFKDLLERTGMLQCWYDYEAKAEQEALLSWCRRHGIQVEGQGSAPGEDPRPTGPAGT